MTHINALAEQMGVADGDRYTPQEDDDLLLYDRELLDEYIEQCSLAYDAWLHARDAEDAARGGDADARP